MFPHRVAKTDIRESLMCTPEAEVGTFCFAEVFPDYKGLTKVPATVRTRSCAEIFNDFLHHERRRVWLDAVSRRGCP